MKRGGHFILQLLPIKFHQPPYPIKNERSLRWVVSFTAVFKVVTQRSSPQAAAAWGRGALRDFGPSGCEGDYKMGRVV